MSPTRAQIRFRERAELLDFLLEAAQATAETLDLDQLLANVADIVKRVLPTELFAILLYSERLKGLRIRYSIGHRQDLTDNLVLPLGEGITGIAAQTMQPILVGNVRSDPRYIPAVDAVRSELAVPMAARGKLVGVIDVQSTALNAYTPYDRSVLQLIASRVSSAIENAKLYRRVERQNKLLRTLSHTSHEISSILSLEDLLRKLGVVVRQLMNYDAFLIMRVDQQGGVLRVLFSLRYDQVVSIDNVPLGSGITGAAVEARKPVKVNDTATDPRYIASHPGIISEVAVPLILQNRVIGVLDVQSTKFGFFTDDHVRILSLLAPHIANAVENARLYQELAEREQLLEQDLKAARRLQRVLQPQAPKVAGLDLALRARPAREVSGDVYDFFPHDNGQMLMVFGDSSGKGAAAALYGALVSGVLRQAAAGNRRPSALMGELNETLLERKVEAKYATLLLALWDPVQRTLTLTNAGSSPPLVLRGNETVPVRVEGVPIGLLENQTYDELVFQAQPGDIIVLYSDGVTDQQRPAAGKAEAAEYGEKRLQKLMRKLSALPAKEMVTGLFQDLDTFAAGGPITDDQSVVVLKVQ